MMSVGRGKREEGRKRRDGNLVDEAEFLRVFLLLLLLLLLSLVS